VSATDGDIGSVADFLLDDEHWAIRYLVADTDGFFDGRRVLISPISLRQPDWSTRRLHVALTRDKVKNSPGIDKDEPVSRRHERKYNRYYGYPYYWGYSGLWGMGAYPGLLAAGGWHDAADDPIDETGDVHLRSASEVRGYHIQGSDAAIGHVEDFIVDDETWQVRYLVIDTSNWWFGKKVLVAPHWASRISWEERKVYVDLSRQTIKNSPEWNASAAVNREYEARLYDYHGRPVYWGGIDPRAGTPSVDHSASHPG
jgi:hypothetical protein